MKNKQKQGKIVKHLKKHLPLAAGILVVLSLVFFAANYQSIKAATYAWMQSSWIGGADIASTASHNTDQSTWTKYYSASSTISAGAAGVALSGTIASTTETTDSDFNAGATSTGYIYVASNAAYPQKPNAYACESNSDNLCQSGRCDTTCQAKLADGNACDEASDCVNSCNGSVCYTPPCGGIASITDDRDTNNSTYNTVEIGTQCWLARNSNVGTLLAGVSNQTNNAILEKYCYNDTESICATDGGLYQWAEAMQYKNGCSNTASLQPTEPVQGICPTGWHIPTDAEQYTLENYLKITGQTCNAARNGTWECDDAGTKLKSGGSSGFNAPLAGSRYPVGSFYYRATYAFLWSSAQYDATYAWLRYLHSSAATVYRSYFNKAYGFSVRCLKN